MHKSTARVVWFVLVVSQLTACTPAWQRGVIRQASFDQTCDDITVLADSGDRLSRSVELEVCGHARRYRDLGGKKETSWFDVTSGSPPLYGAR